MSRTEQDLSDSEGVQNSVNQDKVSGLCELPAQCQNLCLMRVEHPTSEPGPSRSTNSAHLCLISDGLLEVLPSTNVTTPEDAGSGKWKNLGTKPKCDVIAAITRMMANLSIKDIQPVPKKKKVKPLFGNVPLQNFNFNRTIKRLDKHPTKPRLIQVSKAQGIRDLDEAFLRPPIGIVEDCDGVYFVSIKRSKNLKTVDIQESGDTEDSDVD